MKYDQDYSDSQLDALEEFYGKLSDVNEDQVSMRDAIVLWFTEGYAEEFRETFLEEQPVLA